MANIFFEITDNTGPVVNATIAFGEMTSTTNSDGSGQFVNQPARKTYQYLIEKDGFNNFFDSVSIEIDTLIKVILIETSLNTNMNSILSIYPNPARERINIRTESKVGELFISDMNGRIVRQQSMEGRIHSVDIEGLQEGMYIINIRTSDFSRYVNFVKLAE